MLCSALVLRRCMVALALAVATVAAAGGCAHRVYEPRQLLNRDRVPIQYNHGRIHTTFEIDDAQWGELCALFQPPPQSPRKERRAIREAITQIEHIAGTQTPTHRNLGRNRSNPLGDGGMDCRDESTNTTHYLTLLAQHSLLHWHDVMRPVFRGPLQLDSHHSALIRDRTCGELYVVDPWYLDHGHPPRVQLLDDWLRKRPPPEETP